MSHEHNKSFSFDFSIRLAFQSFITIFGTVFLVGNARLLLNCLFDGWNKFHWSGVWVITELSFVMAIPWSTYTFISTYLSISKASKIDEVLDGDEYRNEVDFPKGIFGFLAMEYHTLIMNRSYVVYILEDGLYGWKFSDSVTANNPSFYMAYKDYLEVKEVIPSSNAIRKLSELPGGFFISRNHIRTVEFVDKKKWGMGGIPHSGKLYIKQESKGTREFILLGFVDGEKITQEIINKYGISTMN